MPNNHPSASWHFGSLLVHMYDSREAMAQAAARAAISALRRLAKQRETVPVIFATGESQLGTLRTLTGMDGVPWHQVIGFHMDEYVGIFDDHPASFRRYLQENLVRRASMRRFYEIDGSSSNPEHTCREYGELVRAHQPVLCLLGIGENGHLAFNDPEEADFNDPEDAKIVHLDRQCRQQQVNERWFKKLDEVPKCAITLTIPALLRVPEIILSVPGARKAHIVKRTLQDPISSRCPATILRTHPNAVAFLDSESAAEIMKHPGGPSDR